MTTTEPLVDDEPIHYFFGLTYSNYLVLHRTLMQSMPADWQRRAVAVFEELHAAFAHVDQAENYIVEAAVECEYSDLNDADMAELGVTRSDPGDDDPDGEVRYYDRHGNEHQPWERMLVPRKGGDPVPHYNRGRTRVEPKAPNRAADPLVSPEDDDGGEEVWHEFHDGPWAGQRIQVETSPDGFEHLVPHGPEPGLGEWVPGGAADRCYVRTGSYGETTVMTWRQI